MLARSNLEVALSLLDRYFSLNNSFDHAQAYVDRATALLSLGRTNEAIESYDAALAREAKFPNLQTQAYLDLPYLIAVRGVRGKYSDALCLLEQHKTRLMFPVDHFRWHAASALIAAETKDFVGAKAHAQDALEAATLDHSGFRYHRTVGLVTDKYDGMIQKLKKYATG
jgi:tetratricopeptide (TPR) repeat protein